MTISIYREDEKGSICLVGSVTGEDTGSPRFAYDASYLASSRAMALSFSLPLRAEVFSYGEFRPYFEGLLPEGTALRNLVSELGIREEDWLGALSCCGLDCIGDVIINLDLYSASRGYQALSFSDMANLSGLPAETARSQAASRLSIAGTQNKCGFYHDETSAIDDGWYQPMGGAPSSHVIKFASEDLPDLMLTECLCLKVAQGCGLNTPETHLLDFKRPALCTRRFDRSFGEGEVLDGLAVPRRLHQEDLSQVFGLLPGSKYAELEPSTVAVIARFIREHSVRPAHDLRELLRIICFNYLIGNCDNHLKNLSIIHEGTRGGVSLAPAYDLVSTTHYERFSREMGMRIGDTGAIDDVRPGDFEGLADELGITRRLLRNTAWELAENVIPGLRVGGASLANMGFIAAPYIADDLEADMLLRLECLKKVAAGG